MSIAWIIVKFNPSRSVPWKSSCTHQVQPLQGEYLWYNPDDISPAIVIWAFYLVTIATLVPKGGVKPRHCPGDNAMGKITVANTRSRLPNPQQGYVEVESTSDQPPLVGTSMEPPIPTILGGGTEHIPRVNLVDNNPIIEEVTMETRIRDSMMLVMNSSIAQQQELFMKLLEDRDTSHRRHETVAENAIMGSGGGPAVVGTEEHTTVREKRSLVEHLATDERSKVKAYLLGLPAEMKTTEKRRRVKLWRKGSGKGHLGPFVNLNHSWPEDLGITAEKRDGATSARPSTLAHVIQNHTQVLLSMLSVERRVMPSEIAPFGGRVEQPSRAPSRALRMTIEEAKETADVVSGTFLVNSLTDRVLFDSGATFSFVSDVFCKQFVTPSGILPDALVVEVANGNQVIIRKGVATIYGERGKRCNPIISSLKDRKFLAKGYTSYLAYVMDVKKQKKYVEDVKIVQDYPDVFPEDLPRLPSERQVEFQIDLTPGSASIAHAPYRLAPTEMQDMMTQLQELLEK
ncbi:hypothetical protein L6452_15518 [Arctium lappa]|uniref:Uncharacterized protein n=1 Tax=Arctium lappa TaxID=4217 RepID=A0ACB9CNT4_ARCLA|nr:hypothetical protein L6452_15518 [Arctium lappa]